MEHFNLKFIFFHKFSDSIPHSSTFAHTTNFKIMFSQNSIIVGAYLASNKIHKYYSNIYPTRCNVTQFIILSGNCPTGFGWYHHPSSGAQTTVSTASGICHTVTAICRYRGRVGTGLNVRTPATAHSN
jgi:hypothetical protein